MAKNKKRSCTYNNNKKPIEQYEHKDKERVNNPPVGLVDPNTDPDLGKKTYEYDPHLVPQLQWAGKAERLSFDVDTVSLHVHERIDPRSIIEAVRKKNGSNYEQMSLFNAQDENPPLREAVEFYKHRHNWSNRLIAGDSLLVMNSLIEKEGLAGQVQMIYIDPPYGIKYGSNFQPFVNKRDVKDGKDEDLTAEPETIKAFRDTWELGIHSYLTYLRDRLLLARELLHESGSCFVQISDENVHHVRELLDEIFGKENFVSLITYKKTTGNRSVLIDNVNDYLIWYSKNKPNIKFRRLFTDKNLISDESKKFFIDNDKQTNYERISISEAIKLNIYDKLFYTSRLTSQSKGGEDSNKSITIDGKTFTPGSSYWRTPFKGIENIKKANRLFTNTGNLLYKVFLTDFPYSRIPNLWEDILGADDLRFVVQTATKTIARCLLMTTDPGDLVFDPTCGSGTTAYVAEQWGRRWITCDTSRVAIALAKQRLMTALFDYYELAHPAEGIGSGFKYETVPHITLKSIANNEPPATETLYDKPFIDRSKHRVTGPFTVEAVPSLAVRSIDEVEAGAGQEVGADNSIVRSGETLRQAEWREELLRSGIRGKNKQEIKFTRVEPFSGTKWLHAYAETASLNPSKGRTLETLRAVISFGPEHSPLEQRQVALAIEEALTLVPKPKMIVFAAFQFDPEAAKDIDETNWPGVTLLKVQMNTDLLTDDLKKKRSSNESFWLIGSPDVRVISGEWLVDRNKIRILNYDTFKKLSGIDSLAEINKLSKEDIQFYTTISERRDLWINSAAKEIGGFDTSKHSGRTGEEFDRGIYSVSGDSKRFTSRDGNIDNIIREFELLQKGSFRDFINRLRRNKQIIEWSQKITVHSPLTTIHFHQVEVLGFDYYNTKTGNIESGGKDKIAMWMLDTDYDGRSLFPRQVFSPMSGEKDGWSRLAKNLKAEIDEELIEQYRGTISLPFEAGENKRIAVKIVDDRGIESLKIVEL